MIPRSLRWPMAGAAAATVLHFVPSVVSLGQWSSARALPGGWCRWRGPDTAKVALTFDDGPGSGTAAVLERLDALDLRATFFCLGANVARHPEVVAEIRRRGHQVETHGHRHVHHLARTPWSIGRDLDDSLDALARCGVRPRWFRPPYGQVAGGTMAAARRHGLGLVLWSAWGREWAERDADAVAARVIGALEPGAIVLLHDADTTSPAGSGRRACDALGPVAEALAERRLEAVTLDELVAAAA